MVGDEHTARPLAGSRRSSRAVLGLTMTVVGLALMAFAGLVLFWPDGEPPSGPSRVPPTEPIERPPLGIAAVTYPTPLPTQPPEPTRPPLNWERPTAEPQVVAAALDASALGAAPGEVIGRVDGPLTILPQRSRSTVITYSVKKGDNLGTIAKTFGITENTIIWSNDRFYVNAMRVGLKLNILPVDGVYHHVNEPQTIADIADLYEVGPYDIIDSEYNSLFGATPETILPEGLYVVVPGGTGSTEPIYWDPGITMTTASGQPGALTSAHGYASFGAADDAGSCGREPVYNATLPVGAPIWRGYRITQDFSWNHGGIDLAVPAGTPVYAAGGGTVIFNGWSSWGYGYTVVIAHGGSLTLYGHLNGSFVRCGEVVEQGQNIAVSGNSGNSSGPHLHFEIRGPDGRPTSPWNYQKF